LIVQQYDAYIAMSILLINWILTLLYTSITLWIKGSKRWTIDKDLFFKMLTTGLVAHFASIVTLAAQRLDLIMVNNILGQREAGIYFLAIMLTGTLTIIPSAVQSVLYPKLAEAGIQDGTSMTVRIARITFLIMILACAALAVMAWPAVRIVGGLPFMEAVPLILIMLPGVALYSIPVVLAGLWNSRGIFRLLNLSSILMFAFIIAADYFLISLIGLTGAAISALSISGFSLALHLYFLKTVAGIQNPIQAILPGKEDILFLWNLAKSGISKFRR